MLRRTLLSLFLTGMAWAVPAPEWLPQQDLNRRQEFIDREADWRNGAVVYQIFVDRFAPSRNLEGKRGLYAAPRKLRAWSENPVAGSYLKDAGVWSHEVDYWGGDLDSVRSKLDYLQGLGVDVVYLNPIFESLTNHKYDAWDYHKVDPVYGSRKDVADLAADLHGRKMRLMLDGVFNHVGKRSPYLKDHPDFFKLKDGQPISWLDVENLPELQLENPKVRDFLYGSTSSVVQSYLRQEKIDGWRLDVAFDLGFRYLSELTKAAHEARPGCDIIGEIWNYPEDWHPAVDGVMNMHGRVVLLRLLEGKLKGPVASAMWESMVADAGYEHLLKAWLVMDNHDTPRLNHILKQNWQVEMARVLQFTLPGSPVIYYGSELDLPGGDDPANRAPMRWEQATESNKMLALHRQLVKLRRGHPALRIGDFRRLHSDKCFGFLRKTLSAKETVVVVANPTDQPVEEFLQLRDGKLQDVTKMVDLLGSSVAPTIYGGSIEVTLQPHQVVVLKPDVTPMPKGYDRYDRMP